MDSKNEEENGESVQIKLNEIKIMPLLIAVIVGFALVAVFVILRRRASRRRDFLLIGLCESGKTAIFMQLLYGRFPVTFTTIIENVGEYRSGRMSGRLIDLPGHYRVREKTFDKYKCKAKGIIFVLDSITVQKDVRDVSDALYTVLADSSTQSCPILILCNKQDEAMAKGVQIVKSILEKELNTLRDTRSRKLGVVDEDESHKMIYLGKEGRDFEFAHVPQNVQFYECSAKNNELGHLTDWIDRML